MTRMGRYSYLLLHITFLFLLLEENFGRLTDLRCVAVAYCMSYASLLLQVLLLLCGCLVFLSMYYQRLMSRMIFHKNGH